MPIIPGFVDNNDDVTEEMWSRLGPRKKQTYKPNTDKIKDFIGQESFKQIALLHINHCQTEKKAFPHVIFHGPPGLGKTTLANAVAESIGSKFYEYTAGSITKVSEIRSIVKKLRFQDVLFIDEVHALKRVICEELYSVLQDFKLGNVEIPMFTFVGATTDAGLVPRPLLDRTMEIHLTDYSIGEIAEIIKRHSNIVDDHEARYIAKRSFGNPRFAVKKYLPNLLAGKTSGLSVEEVFSVMQVDKNGLSPQHKSILRFLYGCSKPVGLESIAFGTNLTKTDIQHLYEAHLIKMGLITRSSGGRELTDDGEVFASQL